MKIKYTLVSLGLTLLSACQVISPVFVEYNGVRMDVAKWINNQQLLSMQEKRSLVQLSKAQQQLVRIDNIPESKKIDIAKENAIAMHCAQQHLSANKIEQLQTVIFTDDKLRILTTFDQQFPKLKLDAKSIQCD